MQDKIFKITLVLLFILGSNFAYADTTKDCKVEASVKNLFKDIPNIRFFDKALKGDDFAIIDVKGNEHKLSEFANQPIILALWATWCVPCRHEIPQLAQINKKIPILAVNVDNSSNEKVFEFMKSVKAENLPIYRDKEGKLFANLREESLVFGLPTVLLFNKKHCLFASINGLFDWDSKAAHNLLNILATI